jgi:MFS family permease
VNLLRRVARVRMLEPLHERDFALLSGASAISLLGDGFFYVALAWQVYEISNMPTALSLVGVAWTLPLTIFLLLGGALSDRYDRRRLMIGADVVRAAAIGAMAILSMTGVIELWHLIALIGLVGIGDAFFNPASTALVPDLVSADRLPQANALAGMYRPLTIRLLGPALGGLTVALLGPGAAFGVDALTFVASGVALAAIRPRRELGTAAVGLRRTLVDIGEGFRFVRANPWCWATLVAAMLSLLVFFGPVEVLVPYLVKNRLQLGPESLGAIFAFGGVGAIVTAIAVGQLGLPRRRITVMYAAWSVGVAMMAVYGLMTSLWQALVVSLILHGLFELGQIIWVTLLQQLVPRGLLGRVSSLDWLVSIGLVPISFALTGPVAEAIGPSTTMVAAALVGAVFMGMLLFVPGVRDPERTGATERPTPTVAEGSGR